VGAAGVVGMIMRMFPPFPVPGFSPNFTGLEFDGIDWYDIHRVMAQPPNVTVTWVRVRSDNVNARRSTL